MNHGISVLVGLSGSCWLGVSWTKSRHFQVDAAASNFVKFDPFFGAADCNH